MRPRRGLALQWQQPAAPLAQRGCRQTRDAASKTVTVTHAVQPRTWALWRGRIFSSRRAGGWDACLLLQHVSLAWQCCRDRATLALTLISLQCVDFSTLISSLTNASGPCSASTGGVSITSEREQAGIMFTCERGRAERQRHRPRMFRCTHHTAYETLLKLAAIHQRRDWQAPQHAGRLPSRLPTLLSYPPGPLIGCPWFGADPTTKLSLGILVQASAGQAGWGWVPGAFQAAPAVLCTVAVLPAVCHARSKTYQYRCLPSQLYRLTVAPDVQRRLGLHPPLQLEPMAGPAAHAVSVATAAVSTVCCIVVAVELRCSSKPALCLTRLLLTHPLAASFFQSSFFASSSSACAAASTGACLQLCSCCKRNSKRARLFTWHGGAAWVPVHRARHSPALRSLAAHWAPCFALHNSPAPQLLPCCLTQPSCPNIFPPGTMFARASWNPAGAQPSPSCSSIHSWSPAWAPEWRCWPSCSWWVAED